MYPRGWEIIIMPLLWQLLKSNACRFDPKKYSAVCCNKTLTVNGSLRIESTLIKFNNSYFDNCHSIFNKKATLNHPMFLFRFSEIPCFLLKSVHCFPELLLIKTPCILLKKRMSCTLMIIQDLKNLIEKNSIHGAACLKVHTGTLWWAIYNSKWNHIIGSTYHIIDLW